MASTSFSPLSSFPSSSTISTSASSCGGRALHPATRVNFRRKISVVSASCASATAERPPAAAASSLYEVLGIQAGATCQEIKLAYRSLARVLHPDVAGDCSGRDFMRVHEAYATLSDPQKRADYDIAVFARQRRVGPPFSSVGATGRSVSAYTRRRWETDQCW